MSQETKQDPFITYLEKHAEDRAMLAELRRGLGRSPGEVAGMFPYVVPFVHNKNDEDHLYLVASLFALHPASAKAGNMGTHLRTYSESIKKGTDPRELDEATTRRFVQLLSMSRAALDTPLRQHISLLKSKDIPVNWHQLRYDIGYWNHEAHFVQKSWASQYWRSSAKKSKQS